MNIVDLCIVCMQGIGRVVRKGIAWMQATIRLCYRQWWIVGICMLLMVAAALYYARPTNRRYMVDGVLILNGPKTELVRQCLLPITNAAPFSDTQNSATLLGLSQEDARNILYLKTFDVIDCLADSTADFVDYKNKASRVDTLNMHMTNRLAIRWLVKDANLVPQLESAMLNYLNSTPQLITAYTSKYNAKLQEQTYCQTQLAKLDSLTSTFYFETPRQQTQALVANPWTLMVNDRRITLFLDDIRTHINHLQKVEEEIALMTAPVVLENHLVLNPNAKNSPTRMAAFGLIFGWILGCILAAFVENRKRINAWLKQ